MDKRPKSTSRPLSRALSFLERRLNARQNPVLMTAQEKLLLSVRRYLMERNASSSLLGDPGEVRIRSKVKVYQFKGTLRREFPDMKEARQFAETMTEKHPDLLFEPFMERRRDGDRRRGHDRRRGMDRRKGLKGRISLGEP